VRPFHHSVRDWITQAGQAGQYVVRVQLGHHRLADEGWRQYERDPQIGLEDRTSLYFILHLPIHLSACHRKYHLTRLLLDCEWMQAKLEHADVSALLADYQYLKEQQTCRLVRDAIQLSAYVISRYPEQLVPQLVGRLLPRNSDPLIREFNQRACRVAPMVWYGHSIPRFILQARPCCERCKATLLSLSL
jgi:hypothetical protein